MAATRRVAPPAAAAAAAALLAAAVVVGIPHAATAAEEVVPTPPAATAAADAAPTDGDAKPIAAADSPPASADAKPPARRFGSGPPKWSYDAPQWAALSDAYKLCADEPRQSPIDLSYKAMVPGRDGARPYLDTAVAVFQAKRATKLAATAPLLIFDQYVVRPPALVGDAPPVDVWQPPVRGAILNLPGVAQYGLVGFDVHAGSSEHTVDGSPAVAEMHFLFTRIGGAGGIPRAAVRVPGAEDKEGANGAGGRGAQAAATAATAAVKAKDPDAAAADARYAAAEADAKAKLAASTAGGAGGIVNSGGTAGGATASTPAAKPAADAPSPATPKTAIVAVLFKAAPDGAAGDPFLTALINTVVPSSAEEAIEPVASLIDLDLSDVLAPLEESEFATYVGSQTTPPCGEAVRWVVYGHQLEADAAQVAAFVTAQGGVNARPVQAFEGKVERYAPLPADVAAEAEAAAAKAAAAAAAL